MKLQIPSGSCTDWCRAAVHNSPPRECRGLQIVQGNGLILG